MTVDPITTSYMFNGQTMPGIWRYLLPKEIHQYRIPKERRATCLDCPQAKFEGYDATYRCCSYHPLVPNFLLGLGLRDETSKKAVHNLLEMGWLLPEGMCRTPQQWVDYLVDLGEEGFGEAKRVRCPNLNQSNGYCNIHAFRNAVCSTFFCLNDHGSRGIKFWETLEEMVTQTEFSLAQWTLEEIGFDVKEYYKKMDGLIPEMKKLADPKTHCWTKKARKHLWGKFYGKEIELLRRCGDLVSDNRDRLWEIAQKVEILEAEKFEKAMNKLVPKVHQDQIDPEDLEPGENVDLKELFRDVRASYRKLRKVPEKLQLSPRALLEKNPQDDKQSKAFSHKAYRLEFYARKGGHTVEWTEFLDPEEAEGLREFRRARKLSPKLLEKFSKLGDPMDFLAEQVGKRVLEPRL